MPSTNAEFAARVSDAAASGAVFARFPATPSAAPSDSLMPGGGRRP